MSNLKKSMVLSALAIFMSTGINAQKKLDAVLNNLDAKSESYGEIAQTIWNLAEMGYQEEKSAALLQKTLADAGFTIKKGVAGIPTAFIAEYGSGAPIIGIMGEYDALPGLSQQAVPEKKSAGKALAMPADTIYSAPLQQRRP